jgi:ADP-ribosylglycohydrolase
LGACPGFAYGDAPGASVEFMASAQVRADCGMHRDISPSDFREIPPLGFQQAALKYHPFFESI